MARYKQMIHIEGKSIEDIFRLPCVRGAYKNIFGVLVYDFYGFVMGEGSPTTAGVGDWVCEQEDGRWYIENDKPE